MLDKYEYTQFMTSSTKFRRAERTHKTLSGPALHTLTHSAMSVPASDAGTEPNASQFSQGAWGSTLNGDVLLASTSAGAGESSGSTRERRPLLLLSHCDQTVKAESVLCQLLSSAQ